MALDINTNPEQSFASLTSYKAYVARISQAGDTTAPTAIILNGNDSNYLGTITWTRDSAGNYLGSAADGTFPYTRTFILITSANGFNVLVSSYPVNNSLDNGVYIEVGNLFNQSYIDGWEANIEIRVYQ